MRITDVKIRKRTAEGKMKAVVSVILDDSFAVHDIKVIEHDGRLFAAMPSKRMADGAYRDIVHPINQQTRDLFQRKIMEEYRRDAEQTETVSLHDEI